MSFIKKSQWDKDREMLRRKQGFDERMSNTEVQRRMLDYRSAGINPMMAGDFSASSPTAAVIGQGPDNSLQDAVGVASSAVGMARQKKEIELLDEQRNVAQSQDVLNRTEAGIKGDWMPAIQAATVAEIGSRGALNMANVKALGESSGKRVSESSKATDPAGYYGGIVNKALNRMIPALVTPTHRSNWEGLKKGVKRGVDSYKKSEFNRAMTAPKRRY